MSAPAPATDINRPANAQADRAALEAEMQQAVNDAAHYTRVRDEASAALQNVAVRFGGLKARHDLATGSARDTAAPPDSPTPATEAGTQTGGGNLSQWNTLIPGVCDAEEGE